MGLGRFFKILVGRLSKEDAQDHPISNLIKDYNRDIDYWFPINDEEVKNQLSILKYLLGLSEFTNYQYEDFGYAKGYLTGNNILSIDNDCVIIFVDKFYEDYYNSL